MILIVDNYDSFTYNLYQIATVYGNEVLVKQNDDISLAEIFAFGPQGIILSPGPGHPRDARLCREVVAKLDPRIPILGVCLGHQVIALSHGAEIIRVKAPMHGVTKAIQHNHHKLFSTLENNFNATCYNSLTVSETNFPSELTIEAKSKDGEIMAISHKTRALFGVQFHPESILSVGCEIIIKNFVELCNASPIY